MCRQGLFSFNDMEDINSELVAVSAWYAKTQPDGFGYSFINPNGTLITRKSHYNAAAYFLKEKIPNITTNALIYHTRTATGGGITDIAAHPYKLSNVSITHNGVLFNYTLLKTELEKKYKFQTEVDSEIILYSFLEWGLEFPKVFKEYGVGGYAAIQILTKDGTIYVYKTLSSEYVMKEYEGGMTIGMSDATLIDMPDIESGKFYRITGGKISKIIDSTDFAYSRSYTVKNDFTERDTAIDSSVSDLNKPDDKKELELAIEDSIKEAKKHASKSARYKKL
ncbi:MAG: class II glutamine amidotransferase [Candidatus Parvarchaeum sp.]